jgi:CRISPR-associated protein Cmr6
VPFLVTAAGASFLFAMLPAPGRSSSACASEADLERALDLLCEALEWEGAGAKTAVGYGRFERVDSKTAALEKALVREEAERARARLKARPGGAVRLEVEEADESGLLALIQSYLGPGSTKELEEGDREAFVAAIRELRGDWIESWRDGNLADGSKVKKQRREKLKKRARLVDNEPKDGSSTPRGT